MTNQNIRIKNLTALVAMAAIIIAMASCTNDNTASAPENGRADTSTKISADSGSMKAVAKLKKGRASAMVAMENNIKMEKDKEGVYSKAEKMPVYPGGETALSTFVENNITYPQDAIDQNTEGTVNVSFVIDEKGRVIKPVTTGKSAGHGLDEEAVKIVSQMPAWKPGRVKGKAVKTRLLLPVTFKLADA